MELTPFRLTLPLTEFQPLAALRGSPWSALTARFGKDSRAHRGRNSRLAHRARQDSGSLPLLADSSLGCRFPCSPGSSPVRRRSINNYPAAAGGDLSATSIGAFTAISMVATPHWGDCSLSIDLVLLNSSLSTLLQELVLHCWGCCGLVRLTYR